jgi:hypothetical protein
VEAFRLASLELLDDTLSSSLVRIPFLDPLDDTVSSSFPLDVKSADLVT